MRICICTTYILDNTLTCICTKPAPAARTGAVVEDGAPDSDWVCVGVRLGDLDWV
jgi:hypothetical protein